jgi:hypothetical protein
MFQEALLKSYREAIERPRGHVTLKRKVGYDDEEQNIAEARKDFRRMQLEG